MVPNRDGDGKTDKRRFDMRRHVVITFYGMFIEGFPFLDETVKAVGKIFTDRRVVVFVKSQSRRSVLDEQVQDTCFRQFAERFHNFICNEVETARIFG